MEGGGGCRLLSGMGLWWQRTDVSEKSTSLQLQVKKLHKQNLLAE